MGKPVPMPGTAVAVHDVGVGALALVSALMLAAMTIGGEALLRSSGLRVLRGVVDLSEHALFCIAVPSAPWLLRRDGRLSVNVLVARLPGPASRAMAALTDLIGLAACAVLPVYGLRVLGQSCARGQMIFQDIVLMDWWLQWQLPLAALLMGLGFAGRLLAPRAPRSELDTLSDEGV